MSKFLENQNYNASNSSPAGLSDSMGGITKDLDRLRKDPRLRGFGGWRGAKFNVKNTLAKNADDVKVESANNGTMKTPKIITKQTKKTVVDSAKTGADAKAFREQLGVSLTDLAERLGVTKGNLSAHEAGRRGWTKDFLLRYTAITREIAGE